MSDHLHDGEITDLAIRLERIWDDPEGNLDQWAADMKQAAHLARAYLNGEMDDRIPAVRVATEASPILRGLIDAGVHAGVGPVEGAAA